MAGLFPVFFKEEWSAGTPVAESTFHLGIANAAASVAVALMAPVLGAVADRGAGKKRFLAAFTALGVAGSLGLSVVGRGAWGTAAAVYALATVGFSGGNVFYDALLPSVADGRTDRVSALGYALGYLGGGALFAVNVVMIRMPQAFGLADAGQAVRISFASVAVWWAVFAIPLFRAVPEPPAAGGGTGAALREGLAQLARTFRRARRLKVVLLFLAAYWLYIDGVGTVIRMAVDYGLSLGFPASSLIVALLLTQAVGFPAALVFGRLGEWLGTKRAIVLGLVVYLGVTGFGAFLRTPAQFFVLAAVVGLVQGGVQALSRALYARLVPEAEAGEFFGFFNLLGKFAAILGPLVMGLVAVLTGSTRVAIASVSVLFLAGGLLLLRVDEAEGRAAAAALEAEL